MSDGRSIGPSRNIRPVPCPAASPLPLIPVFAAPSGHTLLALSLSPTIAGYLTHYVLVGKKHRTVPCTGSGTFCEGCRAGQAKRWKGYLAALVFPVKKRALLELTAGSFRNNAELQKADGALRGRFLRLERFGSRNANAPARCVLLEDAFVGEPPMEFNVHAALLRLWGFSVEVGFVGQPEAAKNGIELDGFPE